MLPANPMQITQSCRDPLSQRPHSAAQPWAGFLGLWGFFGGGVGVRPCISAFGLDSVRNRRRARRPELRLRAALARLCRRGRPLQGGAVTRFPVPDHAERLATTFSYQITCYSHSSTTPRTGLMMAAYVRVYSSPMSWYGGVQQQAYVGRGGPFEPPPAAHNNKVGGGETPDKPNHRTVSLPPIRLRLNTYLGGMARCVCLVQEGSAEAIGSRASDEGVRWGAWGAVFPPRYIVSQGSRQGDAGHTPLRGDMDVFLGRLLKIANRFTRIKRILRSRDTEDEAGPALGDVRCVVGARERHCFRRVLGAGFTEPSSQSGEMSTTVGADLRSPAQQSR